MQQWLRERRLRPRPEPARCGDALDAVAHWGSTNPVEFPEPPADGWNEPIDAASLATLTHEADGGWVVDVVETEAGGWIVSAATVDCG